MPVSTLYCRDGLEDPLDDQGMISQQLDQASLCYYVIKFMS